MDYEIKILPDPLPFEKIAALFKETYSVKYFESGSCDWANPKYMDWYLGAYHHNKRFFYSAWKGDRLIATMFGTPNKLKLENKLELNPISIGLTATLPEFQRQGIQKALLTRMIEDATNAGIDFLYSFPEKGFGGNELLKNHFNFKRLLKNQQHFIKVMSDYGRKILHDYRGLNIVLAKLLKLYAGIPNNELEGGAIRDGKDSDIPTVTNILNSYQKRIPISQIWTESHVREEIEGAGRMNEMFEEPWGFHWKIWERDGKILGSMLIRIEMIHFKKGSAPVALMSETVFHEEATISEKAGVVATIVRWVRDKYPKVFTVQTTQPQYEIKAYKALKFIDDTSTYEFLVLPLSEKGQTLVGEEKKKKKYKELFMPYHR
ncbi:MAG: GNAT family N-acetyltransferase [Candidatus Helarchaeota archaeon]|nr:GNAT family N-acetyltransferase [Candidatus Helarchaeota archaeon]